MSNKQEMKSRIIGWIIAIIIIAIIAFVIQGTKEERVESNEVESKPLNTPTLIHEPSCDCNGNNYNCGDFNTKAEAQECFEDCGGIKNDVHWLDDDKDGLACEWNS